MSAAEGDLILLVKLMVLLTWSKKTGTWTGGCSHVGGIWSI